MFRSQQLSERLGGKVDDNIDYLRPNKLPRSLKEKSETTRATYTQLQEYT